MPAMARTNGLMTMAVTQYCLDFLKSKRKLDINFGEQNMPTTACLLINVNKNVIYRSNFTYCNLVQLTTCLISSLTTVNTFKILTS